MIEDRGNKYQTRLVTVQFLVAFSPDVTEERELLALWFRRMTNTSLGTGTFGTLIINPTIRGGMREVPIVEPRIESVVPFTSLPDYAGWQLCSEHRDTSTNWEREPYACRDCLPPTAAQSARSSAAVVQPVIGGAL